MRRWTKHLVVGTAIVCAVSASTPSYAFLSVVFDPQAFSQQMIHTINMMREMAVQAQQYATQLNQYAAQVRNLQNLNYMVNMSGLSDMQKVMQQARGLANDYAELQRTYDRMYPEFSKFSNMSGKDYAQKALTCIQQTSNTNKDAMRLISKSKDWFNSDSGDLTRLTVKANNVSGAKDGIQAVAQIAALQSKQLIQLQQTMSASARSEGAYMAQRAEQEAAAKAQKKRYFGSWDKEFEASKINHSTPVKIFYEK